jgi:prophage regulatory protein
MLYDYWSMAEIVLLGISELRVRLGGVSRQRADQVTRRDDFPKPCAGLAQGRIWCGPDVERWFELHEASRRESRQCVRLGRRQSVSVS